jgi:hypothetical protein
MNYMLQATISKPPKNVATISSSDAVVKRLLEQNNEPLNRAFTAGQRVAL